MGADRATLLDIAKMTDPDGQPAMVAEVLNEKIDIFQDAPSYPSNAQLGNRVTIRSSLPTVAFTKVNQGQTKSKSSTRQLTDTIAMLDVLSEVDSRERKLLGDAAFNSHRMKEDRAFLEAIGQKLAETILYGDESTTAVEFTGLAPRMGSLATAITGSQVRSMGSVSGGDGTSIYIVDWGQDGAHLIHPRDGLPGGGGVAGIDVNDRGEERVDDVDGNPFLAEVTQFFIAIGLSVEDPRHIGRLANIDVSDANVASPTQGQLVDALIDTMTSMPKPGGMQRVLYCCRELEAAFHKQAKNKSNLYLTLGEYLGQMVPMFWGYPIKSLDGISKTESTVS